MLWGVQHRAAKVKKELKYLSNGERQRAETVEPEEGSSGKIPSVCTNS